MPIAQPQRIINKTFFSMGIRKKMYTPEAHLASMSNTLFSVVSMKFNALQLAEFWGMKLLS